MLEDRPVALDLPDWIDLPEFPEDNTLTEQRIELGRRLFFDRSLSRNRTVSCATCHKPELAFSDGQPKSIGIDGREALRNSPSLFNVAWLDHIFSDGGSPNLELQVLAPIDDENEMDADLDVVLDRLRRNPLYVELAEVAYQRSLDAYVLTRALAAYQRSLVSLDSRFDRYYYEGDSTALSLSEQRGLHLFLSDRTQCSSCHQLPLFTDGSFRNTGLYLEYADEGRKRVTLQYEDEGKFRVPSLRNVARTAPYMHDGSRADLTAVIEHYDQGGAGHFLQDFAVKPLALSPTEKADLIAFLGSLDGSN